MRLKYNLLRWNVAVKHVAAQWTLRINFVLKNNSLWFYNSTEFRFRFSWSQYDILQCNVAANHVSKNKHCVVYMCVCMIIKKIQRCPLKFHTKFWNRTQQNMHFTMCLMFDELWYLRVLTPEVLVRRAPGQPACTAFKCNDRYHGNIPCIWP